HLGCVVASRARAVAPGRNGRDKYGSRPEDSGLPERDAEPAAACGKLRRQARHPAADSERPGRMRKHNDPPMPRAVVVPTPLRGIIAGAIEMLNAVQQKEVAKLLGRWYLHCNCMWVTVTSEFETAFPVELRNLPQPTLIMTYPVNDHDTDEFTI